VNLDQMLQKIVPMTEGSLFVPLHPRADS
jgi:hypothetical protein